MFDVGFAELFLLAIIGLLVLGPERLPAVARTIGGFMRKARASWISLRNTIESELAEADLSTPIKQARDELKRVARNVADAPQFRSGTQEPGASASGPLPGGEASIDPDTEKDNDARDA